MKVWSYFLMLLILVSCGKGNPNDWPYCWEGTASNIKSCTSTQQLGTSYLEEGRDVSIYSNDNINIIGSTEGNLDGKANSGGSDLFVVQYDSIGVKQWSTLLGSTQNDYAEGSDVDSSGNIYVTGFSDGDFDGKTSSGNDDLFLVKYNSSGAKQWTKLIGTLQNDHATDVVSYSSSLYATGYTKGSLTGSNSGDNDIFLVKFNSSGVEQWRRQRGSSSNDLSEGIDTDSSGYVYIVGNTNGDLTGDSSGDSDVFIAKYNSVGTIQWLKQFDTTSDSFAQGMVIDSSDNIYVTGYTEGSFDGNASIGGKDVFIMKYNTSGTKQWSRQLGTSHNDYGRGISVDSSGNIYAAGVTTGQSDGNSHFGGEDSFVMKFNSSGTQLWTTQIGTSYNDYANALSINSSGSLFITGGTDGGLDGNENKGGTDIFLLKLNSSGTQL